MRLLLFLFGFLSSSALFGQGTTTAEYYQYQRDQQFKKYMETTGSQGMASPANTNFNYSLDKKATYEFFELLKKRNQGNKVVETEEQKRAIRAEMERDKFHAQLKQQEKLEKERKFKEALSKIRTVTLPRNRGTFEGYFIDNGNGNIEMLWGKWTYSGDKESYYKGYFAQQNGRSIKWGQGTEVSFDGSIYTGNWYEDYKEGFGMLKKANGDVYTGDFKGGRYHGLGELRHADGRVETGFFDSGEFSGDEPPLHPSVPYGSRDKKEINGRRKSGKGKERIPGLGGVYNGEFRNFHMHGKGTIKFDNGELYAGDMFYDTKHGKGIIKWTNGEVYEGDWKMNYRTGQGTYRWPDGSVYQGEWKNNLRHGKGKMHFPNGDQYDGEWINNNPSGMGKMTYKDGRIEEGKWKDGKKIRENASFTNWQTATKENTWMFLEAPDTDKNIHRYLADDKLKFKTKSGDYIWSFTNLGNAQPATYQYEAVYEIEKDGNKNGQAGILIEIDEGNAPSYSKLFYLIKPGSQNYYLGLYNPDKSSWTSFTSPGANDGWVTSPAIKGFNDKGISANKLRLKKTTNEFSIYINDQLMFTQNIETSGKPLHKFAGLGIVQAGLMTGNISAISFKSE